MITMMLIIILIVLIYSIYVWLIQFAINQFGYEIQVFMDLSISIPLFYCLFVDPVELKYSFREF